MHAINNHFSLMLHTIFISIFAVQWLQKSVTFLERWEAFQLFGRTKNLKNYL